MENFDSLLKKLAQPARRALANAGIDSSEKLAAITEAELLGLHGIGPNAMKSIMVFLAGSQDRIKP